MPATTPGELAPVLASAIEDARAAWPEIVVPDDVFASYLVARAGGTTPTGVHVRDLYLACGCARGDARAIAALDRVFLAPLAEVVVRGGAPGHVGGEVAQNLRTRLLVRDGDRPPRITEYSGRGALAGWLRIAAVREASKVRRHERVHAGLQPSDPLPAATPEEEAAERRYGDAFREAFRDAFRGLGAEDRLMLRLHFAEGLNLDRLAAALGFSRATAGRRLLAARTRLCDQTMRVLGERLDASPAEVESLLAALRSRLDVSLGALVTAA